MRHRILAMIFLPVLGLATLAGCQTLQTAGDTSPMSDLGINLVNRDVNGIQLRVAEAGPEDGPLIIMIHGWPELAYSWRYQMPALAEAGYRVVAPDMRGYGGSDKPEAIEDPFGTDSDDLPIDKIAENIKKHTQEVLKP